MAKLTVTKLKNFNTLVIRQVEKGMFIITDDSIIISVDTLAFLIKFLVENKYVSRKVLEGILQDIDG